MEKMFLLNKYMISRLETPPHHVYHVLITVFEAGGLARSLGPVRVQGCAADFIALDHRCRKRGRKNSAP